MLFHEIYGTYFRTVAEILSAASETALTGDEICRLAREKGFSESALTIPDALRSGRWPLLTPSGRSVLRHTPAMPMTMLEKRWLKALLLDPRIQLFAPSMAGLEDVEPLFGPDTFVWFDRYADGDDFADPVYISVFRSLLIAIEARREVRIDYTSYAGKVQTHRCIPCRLEYSQKDDKFRVLALKQGNPLTLNLARIRSCQLLEAAAHPFTLPQPAKKQLVLELTDRRNALERAMLHFSHLEKETVRLEGDRYRITLRYQQEDEPELLIRILSFGPVVKVLEPESLVLSVKKRIQKQKNLQISRESSCSQVFFHDYPAAP